LKKIKNENVERKHLRFENLNAYDRKRKDFKFPIANCRTLILMTGKFETL